MNPEVIKHAVCSLYYTPDIQAFDWLEVVEGQMKYNHMSVIFFFLNLTRTRLRKAEFCESYQNEQKSLQLQGRRLRLRISRSHWFRVKKQLVTYRINI